MADEPRKKKKRGSGCFVSCCFGWTLAVVIIVFIALLLILVFFTAVPFLTSNDAEGEGSQYYKSKSEGSLPSPTDIWSRCEGMAKERNVCIGQCESSSARDCSTRDLPGTPPLTPGQKIPLPLTDIRLNNTWAPRHYEISLQPWIYNESDGRLIGTVKIYMSTAVPTNVIVLHARDLQVDQQTMQLTEKNAAGRRINIKNFETDVLRQFIKIYTNQNLRPSREYYLSLQFNGTLLHKDMEGFYRGTYSSMGSPRFLAVTQFQMTGARRAFPCFDEPAFKATFTITLVRKRQFTSLSNTQLDKTRNSGEWSWDTFKKSPIMSTYTVAMFVGQYSSRKRTTPKGTVVRVWAQPDFINYVSVALSVTGEIIEAFEDYTGIKYPLRKTDLIALRDTHLKGMENWGLQVYAENHLLIRPAFSSILDERNVITTIAHEVAHQWFGNLVTMRWWDDTFLNEAFATYMGNHIGVPRVRPSWNQPLYFVKAIQGAMFKDTSMAAKPVRIAGISTHGQKMKEAFSVFAYQKGAAILRMFRYFLKEETFKKAVRAYLREFSYKNTVKDDFINVFDRVAREEKQVTWKKSRVNLTEIATSWLDQTNYPLLEITDFQSGKVKVKQSRFADHRQTSHYKPPFSNYSWHIPFTYANSEQLNKREYTTHWIYRDDVVNLNDVPMSPWKLGNVFLQGFYRVKYDETTWNGLLSQLQQDHKLIPVESRSGLIDDAFALAAEGYTADVTALAATSYLVNETEYIAFRPFFEGHLKDLSRLLRGTPAFTFLNRYVLELLMPNYKRLQWSGSSRENAMEKQLRELVLKEACNRNYQPCVLMALNQFQKMKKMVEQRVEGQPMPKNLIEPDLRYLVYCTAMRHGNEETFNFLMKQLEIIKSSQDFFANELTNIGLALTCAEEPASLDRMLHWAVSTNLQQLFGVIATQPGIIALVWDYIDRNWNSIPKDVDKDDIIWRLTDYFTTTSDLTKIRHFLDDHPEISKKFGEELKVKVKNNLNWVNMNEPELREWLMLGRFGQSPPKMGASGGRSRRLAAQDPYEKDAFRYPRVQRGGLEEGVNFVFRHGKLEVD